MHASKDADAQHAIHLTASMFHFLWKRPRMYPAEHLVAPPYLCISGLGLTLDELGDYLLLTKIIEALAPTNPLFY